MSFTKVTYPPPPPTSNTLTSQERSHLLRSTKKLGKILGSTPHFIDDSYALRPVHVNLPIRPSKDKPHLESVDSSVFDYSSTRSASSSESTMSYESTETNSSVSSTNSTSSYTECINSAEAWHVRKPVRKPPPLLRLTSNTVQGPPSAIASVKPSLETIPASPWVDAIAGDTAADSLRCSPKSISSAASGAPNIPTFDIPSEAALRSAKMERLRRRLGDDVPANLVFPADNAEDATFDTIGENGQSAALPKVSTRNIADKPSPKLPGSTPKSSFSLERPLFAIVEGPDDHVSGCFEFGSRRERTSSSREYGRRRA